MRDLTVRRRTLLKLGAGTGLAGVLAAPPAASYAAVTPREFPIEGSDATVRLLPGPSASALLYAARRFHYEIDTLRPGDAVSDPAGTSVELRPRWYAPGAGGNLLPHQLTVVRDIIAETDGLLAWGGDDTPAREGRFTLTVAASDSRLKKFATRLAQAQRRPTTRIGADPSAPHTDARRRKADKIRLRGR